MIILSFDVGIKNLAYCMIDSEDKSILDWEVLDCTSSNTILKIIELFDSLPQLLDSDVVLIEKQPSFNPKMRLVSNTIYVYFTMRINHERSKSIKIDYYPAKYKLKCCDETAVFKTKSKYRQNKQLGIIHTRHLITTHQDFFEKSKKKDDLADSYLQALSYIIFFMK
jgi:hypothetical protein